MGPLQRFTLAFVGPLAVAGTCLAQAPLPVTGSQVRVAAPCPAPAVGQTGCAPVIGQLVTRSGETLLVRDAQGVEHTLSLNPSTRIEVERSRRRTVLGLGVGAAVGVVTGFFLARECRREPVDDPELCNLAYVITVPGGAGLGALIGSRIRSTHWVAVPMGETALLLSGPGPDRAFALGLSVRP